MAFAAGFHVQDKSADRPDRSFLRAGRGRRVPRSEDAMAGTKRIGKNRQAPSLSHRPKNPGCAQITLEPYNILTQIFTHSIP